MYDIDKELERIIRNSVLAKEYFSDDDEMKLALELLTSYISKLPDKIRIAIRGGGEHTKQLLSNINNIKFQNNIRYIIDNNSCSLEESNYKIITMDEFINRSDVDLVIISSYAYRKEMKDELKKRADIEVFDLYDFLEKNGLILNNVFYYKYDIYEKILLYRQRYRKTYSEEKKQHYLRNLIVYYLKIKDFVTITELINVYIEKKYNEFNQYRKILDELTKLLKNIQIQLSKDSKKHIIINLMDSLSKSEIQHMKYLNHIRGISLFFEHSFTMTPWTTWTLATMFNKKEVIDDSLFKEKILINKESEVIKRLEGKGYRFIYIGGSSFNKVKIFQDELVENEGNLCGITEFHWETLKILINTQTPCCIFIHNIEETHAPYRSSILDEYIEYRNSFSGYWPKEGWNDEALLKQIIESRTYVDTQLEWIQNIYSEGSVNIYMSDHGKAKGYPWEEERVNNVLLIKGKDITPQTEKRLFSLYSFTELIDYILEPVKEKYECMFSEYIRLQMIDVYEEKSVEKLLEGYRDNLFGRGIAYRGLRTKDEKYIRYADEEERYFLLPNEQRECSDQVEYSARIKELREMAGDYFIDIYEHNKFIHSRRLRGMMKK